MNDVPEIRKGATYKERAIRFIDVREKYMSFREKVTQDFNLQSGDGRFAFLFNISNLARSATVFLLFLHRCRVDEHFGLQNLKLMEPNNLGSNIEFQAKFVKLAWVTLFQFQIETLFRFLLKELGEDIPKGYWKICEKIVKVLEIEKPKENMFLLNILANIRNSLHSGGYHMGYERKDINGEINKVLFEFKHGEIVQCVTWDHLAHVWLNLLPLLENIYYHDKVKKINKIVPNQFIPD